MNQIDANELSNSIAIVGLAGHFPQAKDLEAFWENLIAGREVSTRFSREELVAAGLDMELIDNPNYVPVRSVLEEGEQFDAAFFGYSPREAALIDPQQRRFLECVWETLENAGYDPDQYKGAIGLFGGLSMNGYLLNNIMANPEVLESMGFYQVMVSNDKDFLTTRASYKLNLRGPSINVQTACSTSLVAVQLATQSLLNFQCDMALAGGVSIHSPRIGGYLYQLGMIMSPDGHCRAFDHRAQGIIAGEGVGVVALKRYADAVRDRDTVHAIIRGAAINNDGGLKVGYTAPSVNGQTEAILMAQAVAGIDPGSITYIETHGTGTELGDPIEIEALTQAFRTGTSEKGFCAIGSVKTNMGHLDAAAGVAGLIKTVLALKHKMLPASLNFEKPNPRIDFENSPFFVNASLREWKTERLPRRAGVSSFGIGGTNAHVILEEAQPQQAGAETRTEQLLLLSARSEAALNVASKNLAGWLKNHPGDRLADSAYTLQVGRKAFKHRRILVSKSAEEAVSVLENANSKGIVSAQQDAKNAPVVFMFPGQGAQYIHMGRDLYNHEPFFRAQIDRCAEILEPHLGLDLREVLYPSEDGTQKAEELIHQTWITQPALFTIEYSLARLWMSWGSQPQSMVGHSIGEYVAACLSGVFTLEDGLALVAARGKMMQSLPGGGMLSIPLTEAEIIPRLGKDLSLAVINAPKMCVVSGPHAAIDRLYADLTAQGITCRKLLTSHAFHSIMMDPILDSFIEMVKGVTLKDPQIPYLSNLTGTWVTPAQATSPSYWAAHLRSTVRFADNIEALFKNVPILLEVGPGQTLSSLARQHPNKPVKQAALSSLRHPQEQTADTAFITMVLGRLWLAGADLDWEAYHRGENPQRIPLPTYPFEHKSYWIEPKKPAAQRDRSHEALQKRKDPSSWLYLPSWERSAWLPKSKEEGKQETWLVFSDAIGVGQALSDRLQSGGHSVYTIRPGETFERTGAQSFNLKPEKSDQYTQLFIALSEAQITPTRIIHLWTLSKELPNSLTEDDTFQSRGFYSLLALAQALGERSNKSALQWIVVSNQLHEVIGGESLCAAKATLLGPCKVIPQEYPELQCRSVDIVLPAAKVEANSQLISQILSEFDIQSAEPVAAHRGTHRWVQTYIPHPLPAVSPAQLNLRPQGVYLITGGYGGLGLTLAGFLAKTVHARIVLIGRSGLPERDSWQEWLATHEITDRISRKILAIQEIESQGSNLLLLKADVSDPVQMKAALAKVRTQFGAINGVIHAAGIPAEGIIALKSIDQAAKVLASKVQGTWILDHLVEADRLDFFVVCSSINSIIGGVGQVDYCAANAFLDAFAAMKTSAHPGANVISVNWSAWQEVGMAVETEVPARLKHFKEENLRNGISPMEGAEAFTRILGNPAPQIIVSPVNLDALLDTVWIKSGKTEPGFKENAGSKDGDPIEAPQELAARPDIQSSYVHPTSDTEKKMTEIWQNLLGVEPIGIHDNFFELGGHSLMATQILSRIRDQFNVELSLRVFFEANTIAEICKRIDAILWVERKQDPSDSAAEDREEIAL